MQPINLADVQQFFFSENASDLPKTKCIRQSLPGPTSDTVVTGMVLTIVEFVLTMPALVLMFLDSLHVQNYSDDF